MIRSSFWLVSLLFILPLSVLADVSLESLMRSYQERYKVSKANVAKVWPANPASEAAPEFPPDGFYTRGVSDPVIDAAYQALRQGVINGMFDGVNDVTTADKLMDDWLLDGDLEGVHFTSFNSSSALKSFEKPITLSLDEKSKMAIIARRLTKMQWRVAKMNVDYKFYEGVALANDPVASINAAMINALAASPMQSSEIDAFFSPYSWRYKVTLTPYPPVNTVYEGQYAFLKAKATRESSLSAASNPTLVEYRPYYTLFTASDLAATDTPPIKVFRSLPEGEEVTWHPIIPAAPTAGGTGVVFSGKPLFYATARYKFRYIPEEGCGCASCAPGFVEAKANSLHFRLGLGLTDGAQSSAALEITAEVPGSLLAKPEGLYLPTGRGVTVVRGGSPLALKQIVTAEHVVEVTAETARRYHLDWYKRSAGAPAGGTGLYPRSSTRLSRLTVENPNAANANTLNVKRYEGAATVAARTWTFVYSTSTHTWSLTDSLNAYEEKVINSAITVSGITYATEDRQTLQGTTLVRHTRQKFQNYAFGKVLVEEVNDPNGKNDLTTMSYYTNSATDGVNYGRVKQVVQPSGAWKRYEYDQAGRVIKTVSSYLDSPLTAAESAVRVMTTSYQSPTQAYTLMIETIQGIEISRRYTVERLDGMDDILCTVPGATVNAASNLVTSSTNYLSGAFAGRLKSVINPDGTGQLLTYSADVVNAVTGLLDAAEITTVTKTGGWNGARTVIAVGSQTTSRSNRQGQVVESKTIDIASGLTTAHTQATAFDDYGRVLTQLNVLSAQTTQTVYDCCGLQSMTNERGLTTTYTRSATEEAQTTAGVTTKTVISGLTTIGLRQGSDGSWLELGRQTLNVAGESVSSHSRGTGLVTETHTHDTANQREVHTRTYADGGINVDTSYPDGTALRSTGTATRPMQHEVGVQAGVSIDGVTQNVRWEKDSALDENGALTAEWTRTWTDFAGRVWKVDMANGGVNRSHYNAVGQLIKQVDADSVTTLYAYDSEGQVTVTALDMNRDDSIGYSGTDRITRTTRSVTTRAGTTVQRSLTEVWATDNSAASSTLSITDQSVDGLQRWQEQGNLTTQQYDQPVGGSWAGSWTSTTLYPDNSSSVQTYTLGRMTSSVRRDALNALVESSTNVPDAHGRVSTQTDGRGAVTTLIYETQPNPVSGGYSISADLLYQLKSPPQTLSGTIPVTTYLYDAMGRRTTTTDALAGTTIQTYTKRGEVETISGTRQYPLSYTYTAQGRMKTMITSSGMTTWNYHSDSGLLANKIYGAQTAYSLTYTPAARPLTKTNGRSTLITYGNNNAGEVGTIDYSDTTADLTLTYDRLGRSATSGQAGGTTHTTNRNLYGQLTSESWAGGLLANYNIAHPLDALRRSTGYTVSSQFPSAAPSILTSSVITYDEASRIKNVSLPSGYSMAFLSPSGSYSAQYGYHPQSNVISTIAMKNNNNPLLDVVYDRLLNGAIKDVAYTAAGGNTSLARSLYGFDDLSRRKQLTREDASTWDWGYNARSEVETAARKFPDNAAVPLESFGYTFDAIGNPLTRTQGTRSRTFTPNALNQIATRTQPSFLPITGSASSTANVIVNSTATQRKQGYFWAEVPVNNSASALYEKVNVTSSLPGAGVGGADLITKITGSLYVPPANQTPMYDADGNLTQDSRWDYAWDAENRLVSMTERVNSAAPSPNNPPRTKLEFVYDPLSRRVGKRVYRWPSGSTAWVLDRTVRFFWDGWHLVYEKHTPAFSGIVRDFHYIWGNDLSGERGGAGSVGGLLFAISAGSYTQTNPGRVRQIFDYNYIPAQDANGNVTSLLAINSDLSIKIDASYHYDAFGQESANTLRSNDVNGREFPFRFSGKYHDAETGLAYYGYRYYNPELGRWISRDPIEESGGVNLYGFCYNDPVNNYDNDGRQVFGLRMSPILEPFVRPGPIVEPMVRPTSPLASNPYPNLPLPVAPPTPQPLPELSPQPRKAPTSQLPEQPKGQNSPEYLYRSMMATSGLPGLIFGGPQLGESARKLGVRIEGNLIDVELMGEFVYPNDRIGKPQGMSVAPGGFAHPYNLATYRLPPEWGGIGKDPVWYILPQQITGKLKYVQDKPTHGVISPSVCMPYKEYKAALESTQRDWMRISKAK